MSWNVVGAPALRLPEFHQYRQDWILGVSLQMSVPVGQYDASKLVNIGTNRWAFKPELGISKSWGAWTVDLAAAVALYTDNTDFMGDGTVSQDPLYAVQGHLVHGFRSGIWVALDGTCYWGGEATVNGMPADTLQRNTRLGLTVACRWTGATRSRSMAISDDDSGAKPGTVLSFIVHKPCLNIPDRRLDDLIDQSGIRWARCGRSHRTGDRFIYFTFCQLICREKEIIKDSKPAGLPAHRTRTETFPECVRAIFAGGFAKARTLEHFVCLLSSIDIKSILQEKEDLCD